MAQSDARRSFLPIRRARTTQNAPSREPISVQLPTLWKAMILTSFLLNLVLILVVFLLVGFGITWRQQLLNTTMLGQGFARTNVSELRDVVAQLNNAHIITTIPLDKSLPLKGAGVVVPVNQETVVTLTEPVPLNLSGADIDLGAGNRLHASNIGLVLPQGTPLKIALKMDIPLDDVTIPIKLDVPVDIPLAQTELGPQFRRLGEIVNRLVDPLAPLLGMEPSKPADVPTTPESPVAEPTAAPAP